MEILILSPHTDDGELGCGATISKFIEIGHNVKIIYFSYCGNQRLIKEAKLASQVLGIDNYSLLEFQVRHFPEQRQKILQYLYDFNQTNHIDIVFTPTLSDLHQDHQVITAECLRAFRDCSIFGYELPWNNIQFTTNCFFSLQRKNIDLKLKALNCYDSQKHNYYFKSSFFLSVMRTRGTQMGTRYAESFEVIKLVLNNIIE